MALDRPPIAAEIRATLAVSAPLAAANLAQMAMQVTNAVMVGHLGAVPLAAAGLGNALNATLLMTSQGLLTAVAPLAAHSIGAGDHSAAGRVAGGGLIVATAVAAPMMATLMVVPPLLSGLGYEPGLVAKIGRFLWAISWGIPGFLGAAVLRFLLIAAFRTRIVMIVPLLAVPLNLVLNWVLIFGHWGMPALGSAGSGCATAIVQWLTLFSFALYMLIARARISVSMGRGVRRQIPGILRLGLPIAAMRGLEIGVFVMTGVMMGMIGADALAAHQLVFNVAGVCFMVPLGLAQAATVRVAYQLGRSEPSAARCAATATDKFRSERTSTLLHPLLSARGMPQRRCRVSIGVNAYFAHGAAGPALCIVGQRSGAPGAVSLRRRRLDDICGIPTSIRGLIWPDVPPFAASRNLFCSMPSTRTRRRGDHLRLPADQIGRQFR